MCQEFHFKEYPLKLFRNAAKALETKMFNAELFLLTKLGNNLKPSNVGSITWSKLWHLYKMEYYIKIMFNSHFDTILKVCDMLTNKARYKFT